MKNLLTSRCAPTVLPTCDYMNLSHREWRDAQAPDVPRRDSVYELLDRAERRAAARHPRAETQPAGYTARGHGFNDANHDERRDPECDRSGRWDHGKNLPYFSLYLSYRIFRRSAITFSPKITL